MGTQLNAETSQSGKCYKQAIYELGNVLVNRFSNIRYYPDFIFNMSGLGRKQKKCLKTIHNFTKQVIKNRQSLSLERNVQQSEDIDEIFMCKKNRTAMLDLLLSAENDGLIDETGIQEEVDTFMFEVRTFVVIH